MEPTTTPSPDIKPTMSPVYTMTPPPVVPPTPPVPPQPTGDHKEVRVILPALLLVFLIAAGYYWFASHRAVAPTTSTVTATSTLATTTTQVIANPTSLPDGFPTDIPAEKSTLTEASKIVYQGHGATQYTASYTSAKTKDALWTIYTNYLTTAGYKVNATSTDKTQGVLDATKVKNELNVVITTKGTGSFVQMTYLERLF